MEQKTTAPPPPPAQRPLASETASLPPPRRRARLQVFVIAFVVLAAVAAAAWYYVNYMAPFESTDDAFVEGYVTFVSPRVSGPVVKLLITDNQTVKAGDLLLEIDPRDYQTALDQAKADLAVAETRVRQADTQITVDQAKADQQTAAVAAAEAVAKRAEADRARYQSVRSESVSKSQLDLAETEASSTGAQVEVAKNQAKAAAAQVERDRSDLDTAKAQVLQSRTRVDQAELQLSYTKITAPRDGRITRRTVEQGAYVQTGQALLALVPDDLWVVANFKETQLDKIRPGQPVSMRVDAYPGREFKGKIDSLQAGSGARFSLLPPENAVGNYVKVVQRVPVKIVFDQPLNDPALDIAPGMSVEPKVRVK
jgi:membrane fusion protein (multidrug efflux system)